MTLRPGVKRISPALRGAGLLLLLLLLLASCFRQEPVDITSSSRYPDDQGVVTSVGLERLTIDGDREYPISPEVESFTTRGHNITPLLNWKDKYVHIGLGDDDEVVWIAGIGIVARVEGGAGTVLYTGVFEGLDEDGNALFEDGTVLRLGSGVSPPPEGSESRATIDVASDEVTELIELNA